MGLKNANSLLGVTEQGCGLGMKRYKEELLYKMKEERGNGNLVSGSRIPFKKVVVITCEA